MLRRKVRKQTVIRAQKEVIEAQNTLIEWLLRKVARDGKGNGAGKEKSR